MSHDHLPAQPITPTQPDAQPAVSEPQAEAAPLMVPEPPAAQTEAAPAVHPEIAASQAEVSSAAANVMPTQKPAKKLPIQSAIPPAANDTLTREANTLQPVDKELLTKAEEKLAVYIGIKANGDHREITPELTEGMKLTLKEHMNGQHDGLELCFQAPMLTTASGSFGEQIIAVLEKHPSFADLFANEKTRPRFIKPPEEGKQDMLHVHVNHLSAAQYIALVNSISETVAMPTPQHEQILDKAKGTAIQPPAPANDVPTTTIEKPAIGVNKALAANDNLTAQVAL